MLGIRGKLSKTAGRPPGMPVHVGEKKVEEARITVIDYDEKNFEMKEVGTVKECMAYRDKPTVTWINVDGLHDVALIEELCGQFGIHPLVIEDIVNTEQRPKTEVFDDCIYTVLKMNTYNREAGGMETEQVSIVFGEKFVLTFQERRGDIFDPVRTRIKNGKGLARRYGADFLAYALLDAVVDSNFVLLERVGEEIEEIEDELIANPSPKLLQAIYFLRTEMITLRKSVWPLREIISGLQRSGTALIKDTTSIYLRDLYDHTIQVIDTVETLRDLVSGMLDIYLSSVSNRMNEVMKVLTIFASIFIPLTFIAGVYGMNFQYMPELSWRWGYFGILSLMLAVGVVMLFYFRSKRWL
jgi:magnesium transporter